MEEDDDFEYDDDCDYQYDVEEAGGDDGADDINGAAMSITTPAADGEAEAAGRGGHGHVSDGGTVLQRMAIDGEAGVSEAPAVGQGAAVTAPSPCGADSSGGCSSGVAWKCAVPSTSPFALKPASSSSPCGSGACGSASSGAWAPTGASGGLTSSSSSGLGSSHLVSDAGTAGCKSASLDYSQQERRMLVRV